MVSPSVDGKSRRETGLTLSFFEGSPEKRVALFLFPTLQKRVNRRDIFCQGRGMHETRKPFSTAKPKKNKAKRVGSKITYTAAAKNKLLTTSCPPFRGLGGKKLKTMKKQILFLAMFTLALIFAGTNKCVWTVDCQGLQTTVLPLLPNLLLLWLVLLVILYLYIHSQVLHTTTP